MPRNIAGPTVRGTDFWGREDDVDALWRMLDRGSVLLTAPRRHGKSSLMCALHDRPHEGWQVVLLDVEYVDSPAEFLTEITAAILQEERVGNWLRKLGRVPGRLLEWIRSAIDEVGVGVATIGEVKLRLRQGLTDPEHWPELAEQLLAHLRHLDDRLLLIVDEFPMMASNLLERDPVLAVRFMRWFRAQRQAVDAGNVRFLLGGSVNIEPALERIGAQSLLNDLQRFRLEGFEPGRAAEFVRLVLDDEEVRYEPGVPGAVVDRMGTGVPFFLQVLLSECIAAARRSDGVVHVRDIEPAYREQVLGPACRHRFSHYQSRMRAHYGPHEQPARLVLAELTRREDATRHELGAVLLDAAWGDADLDQVLAMLESDYYVVRDNGRVRFTSRFLRDWWLRNAPGGHVR